jgi:hypothetical protein
MQQPLILTWATKPSGWIQQPPRCVLSSSLGESTLIRSFGGSANIFQAQMMDLMASLEYVQAYIDDLLIMTRETLDDHLLKIENVLTRLRNAGLKVNKAKFLFCTHEI